MSQTQIFALALLRHVLTFGGGFLTASGYGDAQTVEALTGAVLTLVGGVWSLLDKRSLR